MAIKWVLEPAEVQLSEQSWTSSCDEQGKIVLTKNIVGPVSAVSEEYSRHILIAGQYAQLTSESGSPLTGRFLVLGANYSLQSPGVAVAALNFGTLQGGVVSSDVEGGTDAANTHFETAEIQNMEQPIRMAKFWREAMAISEAGDYQELERNSWKAVQIFIDGSGTFQEIKNEFNAFLTSAGITGKEDAINKMISKRLAGIESFYVPAPVLSVTDVLLKFSFDLGDEVGVVQSELSAFTKIQVPDGYEWLGQADTITFDGTTFRRERSYVGAEYWDEDLYARR